MSQRTTLIVLVFLSLLSLGLSLWAAPGLPEQVPSHWNAAGEVNGYAPRGQALWLLPLTGLALGLLLLFLPRLDPLRKNIELFRGTYHWIVTGLVAFMLYMHALTLLAGLGVAFNMTVALLPALSAMVFGMGFAIERARPNWIAGIRTPWTLSSPTVWAKTHQLGGRCFKIAGLASLLGLLFPASTGMIFSLVPISLAGLIVVIYSYVIYQDEQKRKL